MSAAASLRSCPCCGGPAIHGVILRGSDPSPVEEIRCGYCGLMLQSDVSTHAELADLWNSRVSDTLLRAAIPVLKMMLALFEEQGLPAATELGLLNRIEHYLGPTP